MIMASICLVAVSSQLSAVSSQNKEEFSPLLPAPPLRTNSIKNILMKNSTKKISLFGNKQPNYFFKIFKTVTASFITIGSLFTSILPTMAITDSFPNEYRVCATQLKRMGVTADPIAQSCAKTLHPAELSACVVKINKYTQIPALDALNSCQQARRPQDLATCVVSISKGGKADPVIAPDALAYCGRSLLPLDFAECVIGLRREVDLTPVQFLDTCINARERTFGTGGI
jgi:hypothetical protein